MENPFEHLRQRRRRGDPALHCVGGRVRRVSRAAPAPGVSCPGVSSQGRAGAQGGLPLLAQELQRNPVSARNRVSDLWL